MRPAPRSPPLRWWPRSPATATCARSPTSTRAGGSRSTSATRPRSTARRSRRSGSPPCTAGRSSRSPTRSWSCPDGRDTGLLGRSRAAHATLPASLIYAVGTASKSSLDVLDVDGAVIAVEDDADGVEADVGKGREVGAFGDPGGAEAAHLALLAEVDREDRPLRPVARPGAGGLDLEEDEDAPVERDDVELAVAGAGVALEDFPPFGGQLVGDQVLGDLTGAAA